MSGRMAKDALLVEMSMVHLRRKGYIPAHPADLPICLFFEKGCGGGKPHMKVRPLSLSCSKVMYASH
ncbi:hypothetical protein [Segatella copri]|uniref:Uncharacterized protein n=1 Tax=Segatella copri TaxID=165179 RepID=A0A6G1VJW2_9BACT|nr:hypothetical protein [Segatella copri]MQN60660.1 hypothetical protein [Segatella copri]MQP12834.1 hypothetical protein [Segatella copri]